MLGPYKANTDGTISYTGNNLFSPIPNVLQTEFSPALFAQRVQELEEQNYWDALARINDEIYLATTDYFSKRRALFTLLPLTTRMISSPGAVYGKYKLNYTSDTCPITLEWFDEQERYFLSESSQIYLELALLPEHVQEVYSIYNSFRKEKADATHLSEFHHIEYEGKVHQQQNAEVLLGLIRHIIQRLLDNRREQLQAFLSAEDLSDLQACAAATPKMMTFQEAMAELYRLTGNEKYKKVSLANFGSYEEVLLSSQYRSLLCITQFPLLEVPFYHARIPNTDTANNMDLIWPGYRETAGSGQRVGTEAELAEKAEIFNLPKEDYRPYMQSRQFKEYKTTSGFGIGWERLLQGILRMPYIWSVTAFPRGHVKIQV